MKLPIQQLPDKNQLMRDALFVPCNTKEALQRWIWAYLGLWMPDVLVDPDSTSSPMDALWEIYSIALGGGKKGFTRFLVYSARDAFKTLSAAVMEVLCIFHLNRNVAHMAAIESQAGKAQEYVANFLARPYLRDFLNSKNKRKLEIVRYRHHATRKIICERDMTLLDPLERDEYQLETNYIRIIIATKQGANCIDPFTMVTMANGETRVASEITEGDEVLSFDVGVGTWGKTRVGSVSMAQKQAMRLTLDDGSSVVLSEDHPVFTHSGWVRARALRLGDRCLGPNEGAGSSDETDGFVSLREPCSNPWSAILGTLLGDSSLTWPNNKGKKYGKAPRFSVAHGKAQRPYLERKAAIISGIGVSCSINEGQCPRLSSRTSEKFIDLYNLLYGSGSKRITQEVLDQIDLEALAFWLMDDSSGCPEIVGSRKDKHLSIATCCFSMEENELIASWFKKRWGLYATVGRVFNSSGKAYLVVEFDLQNSRRLSAMVDEFLEPCVKYKFPVPQELMGSRCVRCGTPVPSFDRHGFTGCVSCPRFNLKDERAFRRSLTDKCIRRVEKIEFLGLRELIDIHIDTDEEHKRNFVANSAILLHNSEHVPFMVLDELDLAPEEPVKEARMIPAPGPGGMLPVTLMISTRKTAFGPVQKEIDAAHKTGLQIRHWNIIDVTEPCPPERHLPTEPKIPIFVNPNDFAAINQEAFGSLDSKSQEPYKLVEGYTGCLKNCKIFAACRGLLALKQTGDSELLKPIDHVEGLFLGNADDPELSQAQLMCWKPAKTGLIYPKLERDQHMRTASQMAEMITGDPYPDSFSKEDLVRLCKSLGLPFVAGMDFGYTHMWATCVAVVAGNRGFLIEGISIAELDIQEKLEVSEVRLKPYNAVIFADPAYPADIKSFRKAGYNMRNFVKEVHAGINAVRYKIWPGFNRPPELFFLAGDPGVEHFFKRLGQYHWKLDAAGNATDVPDDKEDDEADAVRYLAQNVFGLKIRIQVPVPEKQGLERTMEQALDETPGLYTQKNWAGKKIAELTGNDPNKPSETPSAGVKIKRGNFFVDA